VGGDFDIERSRWENRVGDSAGTWFGRKVSLLDDEPRHVVSLFSSQGGGVMRHLWLVVLVLLMAVPDSVRADAADKRLDIYFIDVEGGAAVLLVTPAGESLLIDSGYPDNQGRDLHRILHVVRDVCGLERIDHALVSHWHLDHYGNHAALTAEIGIGTFWDRGIPDDLQEDKKYHERIVAYRAASQNASRALTVGDLIPLRSGKVPLKATVVTGSRDVIVNDGPLNAFADRHKPRPQDPTDNAASLSVLFELGDFRFLTCGDLTWNIEAQLVTPRNPIGTVDLFMVTHHGLPMSNNPALVLAIDPTVAIMCNGPTKGGAPETLQTLRQVRSLQDWFQLHRNVKLDDAEQAPPQFIANSGTTESCEGNWIKASVAPDGKTFTVRIGADGEVHSYQTRTH
jgi:competence protein ComEC